MDTSQTSFTPEIKKGSRALIGSALGLAFSTVLITILVIGGELHAPLKDWLKATFSHHWVGKGVLGTAFFVVTYIVGLCIRPTEIRERRFLLLALWVVLLGTIAIVGFTGYEAFIH